MSKALILYYSFEGSTRKIASIMAKSIDADIQEIKPIKDLKSTGFSKYVWGGSQVVMGKMPKLLPFKVNVDNYDTIIVGSPIWAGTFVPAIKTLLEGGILKGKKIGYFYCHKGGDKNAAEKAAKAIQKDNVFVSALSCKNVETDTGALEGKVVEWAKSVIKK